MEPVARDERLNGRARLSIRRPRVSGMPIRTRAAIKKATAVIVNATPKPRDCASVPMTNGATALNRRPLLKLGDAESRRSHRCREDLRSDRTETTEVPRSKERDERAEEQEHIGSRVRTVRPHQHGSDKEIRDVSGLAAKRIRDETKRHITEPHADLHRDDKCRHRRRRQSDAALFSRQRKIRGHPQIQSPPREHRRCIHQRQQNRKLAASAQLKE